MTFKKAVTILGSLLVITILYFFIYPKEERIINKFTSEKVSEIDSVWIVKNFNKSYSTTSKLDPSTAKKAFLEIKKSVSSGVGFYSARYQINQSAIVIFIDKRRYFFVVYRLKDKSGFLRFVSEGLFLDSVIGDFKNDWLFELVYQ